MSDERNVVERLRSCLNQARRSGFNVRMEVFDGEQANWCVIGGVPTLFVDLSQAAGIQLKQATEAMELYRQQTGESDTGPSGPGVATEASEQRSQDPADVNRAA